MADVYDWPDDICPSSLTWRLESSTRTFRSPFNGTSQTVRTPGSRWVCSLTFSNQSDAQARRIEALLAALDGEYGRVRLRDKGREGSTPAGAPVVSDPNQSGVLLYTRGWAASRLVLRAGDYITVNDELKMVTADITSAADGTASIHIAPMLRTAPPAGAALEVAAPYGIFKLKDNSQSNASRVPGVFTSFALEFEEAF
ncbi:hypothetical protein ACBV55_13645 [Franconibacter pulveris]|uniref:hypothetical protein n=1 Tax=Cronobacter sakazakii TaxID=28141 RepID=UPI0009761367|nr:hypothetical protein [Cronobacter sakazakii]